MVDCWSSLVEDVCAAGIRWFGGQYYSGIPESISGRVSGFGGATLVQRFSGCISATAAGSSHGIPQLPHIGHLVSSVLIAGAAYADGNRQGDAHVKKCTCSGPLPVRIART